MSGEEPATQIAPVETPQMVSTVKLLILKKGEYTLWSMRMEQYLTNTDYGLWQTYHPKTAQALLQRQRGNKKSTSILLLAISDEYRLRFHAIKDAKTLWAAIKSRFSDGLDRAYDSPQLDDEDLEQMIIDDLEEVVLIKLRLNALTVIEGATLQGNAEHQEIEGTGIEMQAQDEPIEFALMAYIANSSGSDIKRIWKITWNEMIQSDMKFVHSVFDSLQAPNTRISNEKVNTVRLNGVNTAGQTAVSTVKGNGVTAVKDSAGCVWRPKMIDLNNVSKDNSGYWVLKRGNLQQALKNKGIFDSGYSRHMTGNKDFLIDYQDIDGGFVAFGGSAKGGKITGKGIISTYKLDFEDVFFVKEQKFNLFSIPQMCDKKNSVLFTETECLILSPDFKLLDESQVLLRVPKQSNMYSFDLKNVVPSGDLTCLFVKATVDESNLWHRRLGHVNFKTMNKLVKGNLVRGLPSKIFENDHTCVSCPEGKAYKAF
ncbi:ribonuclease H-like domain-containing protein [Tanacetum coccineum]